MFSKLHDRLGTAGLVIAVVALIAALSGTAFAAATALNGKQKKEVEKIAKKYAGKNGKDGAPGTAGPAGPAGTAGAAGAAGKDGVSVTTSVASGAECATGGVKLTSASGNNKVCNGEEGLQGPAGSPWTAGGVLPKEETETGVWGGIFTEEDLLPISFSIPLASAIAGLNTAIVPKGGSKPECDDGEGAAGSAANPEADPGFVCAFVAETEGAGTAALAIASPQLGAGAATAGAVVLVGATAKGTIVGTFAVTAP